LTYTAIYGLFRLKVKVNRLICRYESRYDFCIIERIQGGSFMYEIIISAIVFTAVYMVLKRYHQKEKEAKKHNSKYHNGQG